LAGEKNAASNLDNLHTGEALAVDETQLLSTLNAFRADGLFVIAGNDVIAAMLAQRLCEQGLQSVSFGMSGYVGLVELYVGGVQAAITHLFDQKTSSYNIAYLRRLAPGMPVRLIHLYRRQIGICVRRGNPKNITSIVRAVRLGAAFANVAKPASARIFLDEQLLDADVKPASVVGYDTAYGSEFLAASAVASREADVCVASVEAARKVGGVEFVPVAIEQVDLAVVKSAFTETYLDAIKQLLSDDSFIRGAEHMVVGDISKMGYVLYDV
jgi:putative molybdopterin biosynthesis protein